MLTCCCIILMFIRLSFVHFPFPLPFPLRLPGCGCSFVRQSPVDIRRILYWPFLHLLRLCHLLAWATFAFRFPNADRLLYCCCCCENSSEVFTLRESVRKVAFVFFFFFYFICPPSSGSTVQCPVWPHPTSCLPFLIDRLLCSVLP